jgi:hypothetical protein
VSNSVYRSIQSSDRICSIVDSLAYDIASIYFVKANVPETKGLNLEQIEQQFREMRSRGNDEEPLLHVEVARQAFV